MWLPLPLPFTVYHFSSTMVDLPAGHFHINSSLSFRCREPKVVAFSNGVRYLVSYRYVLWPSLVILALYMQFAKTYIVYASYAYAYLTSQSHYKVTTNWWYWRYWRSSLKLWFHMWNTIFFFAILFWYITIWCYGLLGNSPNLTWPIPCISLYSTGSNTLHIHTFTLHICNYHDAG